MLQMELFPKLIIEFLKTPDILIFPSIYIHPIEDLIMSRLIISIWKWRYMSYKN